MKKASAFVAAICCVLLVVVLVHSQSAGSGSFSGTVAGQPFSGTFSTSTTDPCSSSAVAKSSVSLGINGNPVIQAVTGQAIYICGFNLTVPGSNPDGFLYGNPCAFELGIPLTGNMGSPSVAPVVTQGETNQTILFVPPGNSLCSNGGQGFVTYVQR